MVESQSPKLTVMVRFHLSPLFVIDMVDIKILNKYEELKTLPLDYLNNLLEFAKEKENKSAIVLIEAAIASKIRSRVEPKNLYVA